VDETGSGQGCPGPKDGCDCTGLTGFPTPPPPPCTDADGDGVCTPLDCDDDPNECGAACNPGILAEDSEARCSDGWDNDCDDFTDCDDSDCSEATVCQPPCQGMPIGDVCGSITSQEECVDIWGQIDGQYNECFWDQGEGCTEGSLCAQGTCNDDFINQPTEVCDGNDVGDATCTSLGFFPGTLGCLSDCTDFDTSGCGECGVAGDCGDDNNDCTEYTCEQGTCVNNNVADGTSCEDQQGTPGTCSSGICETGAAVPEFKDVVLVIVIIAAVALVVMMMRKKKQ
jgi:hypothetical protein